MERILELETYKVDSRTYKHESRSIVATEKMMMKDSSERVLEKTYTGRNHTEDGNFFHVVTHSEKFGKENASLKISRDLNGLIGDIIVNTDKYGYVNNIINKHEVLDKWEDLRKKWKKEAAREDREQVLKTIATVDENLANGSFQKEIAQQGALYFLFNGAYRTYDEEGEIVVQRDLAKFLVTQPLPLTIKYTVEKYDRYTGKMEIKGLGEVAKERLDQQTLNKLVRGIKDKIDLKVELQLKYVEHFHYDRYGWLEKAEQEVRVKIPGFYMAETEQRIYETAPYE